MGLLGWNIQTSHGTAKYFKVREVDRAITQEVVGSLASEITLWRGLIHAGHDVST